ncbi:Hypothetical protein FKW44_015464 [Caligus rogercresseyi]|uniref:Uncharacterized protein n=1 Tax=Caligus rogercresseyi TaxID=217165 RepID=A0A7T8H0I7_CALRO|nr:Hypothetical protein FKW44_015464 [Caligus rogercresseyi]
MGCSQPIKLEVKQLGLLGASLKNVFKLNSRAAPFCLDFFLILRTRYVVSLDLSAEIRSWILNGGKKQFHVDKFDVIVA